MKWIRKNYHWVIALLTFGEMIVFGGMLNSVSVFMIPVCSDLAVTRGSYALALMPYTVVSTISTMLSDFLFQKLGYKRSSMLGLGITALSFCLMAVSRTLTWFSLSRVLMGLGYGVCFTAGSVRILKDWFFKHQGLVTGAVSMASGLGGSLMTLVLTGLIQQYNWRIAKGVLAAVFALTALIYLFFMKNRPEELGLRPYGFGILPKRSKIGRPEERNWPGLSFQEWSRRPLLYMMILSTLTCCVAMYLTSSVLMPHFQDQGFSAEEAAAYQSVYMLVLAGAKLLCGAATDKIGPRPVTIVCLVCGAAGQGILSATADPTLCYAGTILCSIALCATSIMVPLLGTSLFGYRAIGSVNSITLGMASLASLFANPISNMGFDRFGSYCPMFGVGAVMNGLLVAVYLLMFAVAKKEKARRNNLPADAASGASARI